MKQILLVRHAKSSWDFPELSDKDRPLNKRGHRDAPVMAEHLIKLGLVPDILVSSPAKRAYTTAVYFTKAFGGSAKDIVIESDLYFGTEDDWLDIIQSVDDDFSFAAFFSHNPNITSLSNRFTEKMISNVPTCGVIHLQSSSKTWEDVYYDNTSLLNSYFPKLI